MEIKIDIDAKEVEEIIVAHVKSVFHTYVDGKIIHVRGSSYSGLSAVVTIEDAPIDAAKET